MALLKTCPNCGVDAISYDKRTKLGETVWCNNCGAEFLFRQLKEKKS